MVSIGLGIGSERRTVRRRLDTIARAQRYNPDECVRCGGAVDLRVHGAPACYSCAPSVELYHAPARRGR